VWPTLESLHLSVCALLFGVFVWSIYARLALPSTVPFLAFEKIYIRVNNGLWITWQTGIAFLFWWSRPYFVNPFFSVENVVHMLALLKCLVFLFTNEKTQRVFSLNKEKGDIGVPWHENSRGLSLVVSGSLLIVFASFYSLCWVIISWDCRLSVISVGRCWRVRKRRLNRISETVMARGRPSKKGTHRWSWRKWAFYQAGLFKVQYWSGLVWRQRFSKPTVYQ